MPTHTLAPAGLPYEFGVEGSPVSVNRYGTAEYRNWKTEVYTESVKGAAWSGSLVSAACTVLVRYYCRLDRPKDVDNILKAILDGLDGKTGIKPTPALRVLLNDRDVERVVSQRTKIDFKTRISARWLTTEEYAAQLLAIKAQASVFVSVTPAPNHRRSITR